MWHKQGFLKTFLLKIAFILMELIFILRKKKCIMEMPTCQEIDDTMYGCDDRCNYEIMHMACCIGYDVPVMMHD